MWAVCYLSALPRPLGGAIAAAAIALVCALSISRSAAATETPLYSFNNPPDALKPEYGLTLGPDGNFYGVTRTGGARGAGEGNGTIYQLIPPAAGHSQWRRKIIWNFQGGSKGMWPEGPLVFDAAGKGYGTTITGGDMTDCGGMGCGTAYSIAPPLPGKTLGKFTIIHRFHSAVGSSPTGALTLDTAGDLYGATLYGGSDTHCTGDVGGCGVIFKLARPAAGKVAWEQFTLYKFQIATGADPNGGLIFDGAENTLYGTAENGGTSALDGVVFSLTKPAPGHFKWTYAVLHNFQGLPNKDGTQPDTDGGLPLSGLTIDEAGNLYGTTEHGGNATCNAAAGCGVIFKLSNNLGGWTETILHMFGGGMPDGADPFGGLTTVDGVLYGTASAGGGSGCFGAGCGTIYKLDLNAGSAYSTVYAFRGGTDGAAPQYAQLLWDGNATLYGTTFFGGVSSLGTAYSLTLP